MPKNIWILTIKGMNDGKNVFRHVLTNYNSKLQLLQNFVASSFLLSSFLAYNILRKIKL